MTEPLDPTAFEAFEKRCELMGKWRPTPERDVVELQLAHDRWRRGRWVDPEVSTAGIMHWGDYGGRSVYWFSFPQDIGALRVPKDHALVELAESLVANDRALNANAKMSFQAALAQAEREAKGKAVRAMLGIQRLEPGDQGETPQ